MDDTHTQHAPATRHITITAFTHQAPILKQSSIHASLKWQDGGTPSRKSTGLCKFRFWSEFTTMNMSTIVVFVYLGSQYKWNQLSSNNSSHSSCIYKGLQAGRWPDLMTVKPDAPNTLRNHWTDCTWTTLADAIAQWSSSGNPWSICIIGTHWKTTGATSTLGCHWNHNGWC